MSYIKWSFLVLALAGCASQPQTASDTSAAASEKAAPPPLPKTLEEAVQSPYRTAENRVRDRYRHPLETLTFFNVKPDLTVIEIWPGAGYYAQILAPFLTENGKYIAALNPAMKSHGAFEQLNAWMKQYPNVGSKATIVSLNPPEQVDLGAENSADMVLTFRNFHNWIAKKTEAAVLQEIYQVLKPGGILGIVDHRGSSKKPQDPEAKSGYVREDYVIEAAIKAGFQLVSKSEINANPLDTKIYPKGVWTLPPVLALGDQDRDRYVVIGESDRMTLKFIKPVKR